MTSPTRRPRRRTPTQARAARRERRRSRRRFLRYGGATLVAVVAGAFILALFLPGLNLDLSGPFSGSAQGENIPDQDADHILREVSHPEYNSVPATSGWHYSDAFAPATWGVHDAVLPDEELVHNLEHGGIGIHYDCPEGCDELVENLTGVVTRAREQGLKVIMSPYPGMDTTIALAAWTFLDKFDEFDEGRIKDFINDRESDRAAPEPFAR